MNKMIEEIVRVLDLCCEAIKIIHPELNPDEPCIAFEAFEEAYILAEKLRPHNTALKSDAKHCAKCGIEYPEPIGKDVCPKCGY